MLHATFACPDLTTFCRVDELGLEVVGQRLEPGRAVLACRVVEADEWCRRCGCQGMARDTVVRRLLLLMSSGVEVFAVGVCEGGVEAGAESSSLMRAGTVLRCWATWVRVRPCWCRSWRRVLQPPVPVSSTFTSRALSS